MSMVSLYAIEVHLHSHCNLRCKGCAQSSPLVDKRFHSLSAIIESLGRLRPFLRCRTLYALGGEPLLHPELLEAIRALKSSGLSRYTAVKTNGLFLDTMPSDFWALTDEVLVSIYPRTTAGINRHKLSPRSKSRKARLQIALSCGSALFIHPKTVSGGKRRGCGAYIPHMPV